MADIDRDRLRSKARRIDRWALLTLFDRAVEFVPQAEMERVLKNCVRLDEVEETSASVLEEVTEFDKLSRKGAFYESFDVNYKNSNETSKGTEHWLAECERLLRKCARAVGEASDSELRQAFAHLFSLIDSVDQGDGIVFFADEGGSYLLTPDWDIVLPPYFCLLARTSEPTEYSELVVAAIDLAGYPKERYLEMARSAARPDQLEALPH
jgi:hypothetical protein